MRITKYLGIFTKPEGKRDSRQSFSRYFLDRACGYACENLSKNLTLDYRFYGLR